MKKLLTKKKNKKAIKEETEKTTGVEKKVVRRSKMATEIKKIHDEMQMP